VNLAGISRSVATGLMAVLLLQGCGRTDADHRAQEAAGPAAVNVATMRVAASGPAEALVIPARIAAREEVAVTASLSARLSALAVPEGGRFREGQTLALFDAPETRQGLAAARANLGAAQLRRDLAVKQESRMDSLHASRVASLRELELAQSERRTAEAEFAAAVAAEAQWSAQTSVPAPFDGVVVRHRVDPGSFVSPGTHLMDIRSLDGAEIVAPIPESEMDRLAGGTADFQIENGPWRSATLLRLEGMIDFATRTRVARFRARDAGAGSLVPGSFARVRLATRPAPGTRHGPGEAADSAFRMLTVPSRCLVRRGSLTGVYVIHDHRAILRWLRVGRESADWVEVLAGLDSGDDIATEPEKLSDGQRVRSRP